MVADSEHASRTHTVWSPNRINVYVIQFLVGCMQFIGCVCRLKRGKSTAKTSVPVFTSIIFIRRTSTLVSNSRRAELGVLHLNFHNALGSKQWRHRLFVLQRSTFVDRLRHHPCPFRPVATGGALVGMDSALQILWPEDNKNKIFPP